MKVVYESNNSGGGWWLTDQNWLDLEAAGWEVDWIKNDPANYFVCKDGRYLGALAWSASREGLSLGKAIKEWEAITGQDSNDLGCSCCGCPHSFEVYDDDGECIKSYSPTFPKKGNKYKGD